jgi:Ca2+-transporting ATPase
VGTVTSGTDILRDGLPVDPLDGCGVYARVDPSQKLDLVTRLQGIGHVVAVTGDGVNDAPALHRADVGVAMGARGSDVAREASDLVLVDDDLSTIVAAIEEGRSIYDNLRRVIDYLVSGNLSEVFVVLASLVLWADSGLAVTAVQLLWINLLTDGLPAVALGVQTGDDSVMLRPPRSTGERLLDGRRFGSLALRALILALGPTAAGVASLQQGDSGATARTILFTTLVLVHLAYAFTLGPAGARPTRLLVAAVGIGVLLHAALLTVPPMGAAFDLTPIPVERLPLVLVGVVVPTMIVRAITRRG